MLNLRLVADSRRIFRHFVKLFDSFAQLSAIDESSGTKKPAVVHHGNNPGGVANGNGSASDVMPTKITAYGCYNTSATKTTDVTVNNLDPVLTTRCIH